MPLSEDEIPAYYQHCYEEKPGSAQYGRWRELCAVGKADHVTALAAAIGCNEPATLAEVGCGDGSVLAELGRRGFGCERVGLEISRSGAELAARHREITRVEVFDGLSIDAEDDAYDLSFATHVLEHVLDPGPLLREMMRCSKAVIIEVPLENNLSARRPAARRTSDAVGHVQRFDRGQIRGLVEELG